jgi:hypothetical protein
MPVASMTEVLAQWRHYTALAGNSFRRDAGERQTSAQACTRLCPPSSSPCTRREVRKTRRLRNPRHRIVCTWRPATVRAAMSFILHTTFKEIFNLSVFFPPVLAGSWHVGSARSLCFCPFKGQTLVVFASDQPKPSSAPELACSSPRVRG